MLFTAQPPFYRIPDLACPIPTQPRQLGGPGLYSRDGKNPLGSQSRALLCIYQDGVSSAGFFGPYDHSPFYHPGYGKI